MKLDAAAACLRSLGLFSRSRNSLLYGIWKFVTMCTKNLLLNPLLSHLNTVSALTAHLSRIHVNVGLTRLALTAAVVCRLGDLGCFLYMTSN